MKHQSTPGKVFLLEPGDIHDGDAPTEDGFTSRMLYLDPQWLKRELSAVFENASDNSQYCWGSGTRRYLDSIKGRQKLNQFMGLLLLVSTWLSFILD